MRFYRIKATTDERIFVDEKTENGADGENAALTARGKRRALKNNIGDWAEKIRAKDDEINENVLRMRQQYRINFSHIDIRHTVLIIHTDEDESRESILVGYAMDYLSLHDYVCKIVRLEEITGNTYRQLLRVADNDDFIDDYDQKLREYNMDRLNTRYHGGFSFSEALIDGAGLSLKAAMKDADALCTMPELKEEICRIYQVVREAWRPGHPVHYILRMDEGKDGDEYLQLLLRVLYSCNRIGSQRYTTIEYDDLCENYDGRRFRELYRLARGGAMVIKIKDCADGGDDYMTANHGRASSLCKVAMEFKNEALTIFCTPRNFEKQKKVFFEKMDGIALLEMTEKAIFNDDAKAYLKGLVKNARARANRGLYAKITPDQGYTKNDLRKLFDYWYDRYLRKNVFTQYDRNVSSMRESNAAAKGSGIQKLNELIGLTETKALVSDILDFAKAQKLYSFGKVKNKQSMHMVFSGNPGTAKTTVARLVAQIMKENGVLSEGDLIEVGRSDLVGQFVGWTAMHVKNAFERAKGSVLFIDEAYSLVDDSKSFGDEAINTIVQEMENNREDMVVILAGYPDRMEGFLDQNPGLRSRVSFHVNFPDYSVDELCEILKLIAEREELTLADGVLDKVRPIISTAACSKEFGNGRYVRNLLEKARMKQSSRLIKMDAEKVTEQIAATLVPGDFEAVTLSNAPQVRTIGFTA
jgi:AAA+ superfamily predicted ATPase